MAIAVVAVLTVLFRRRWPFAALAVAAVGAIVAKPDGAAALAVLVVLYTIASTRPWRTTAVATAVLVAGNALDAVADGHPVYFGDMVAFAVQCAAAVALGLYFAARRATLDALHERAERMDRERELLADRAVAEERVRIAQELHDVVAHNVSLIVVKAQALGATVPDERVAEATDGIADLGRQTMAEMHRTLRAPAHHRRRRRRARAAAGSRRTSTGSSSSRAPRASTSALAVEGEPRELSQSLDLSAFRIVQEALTNVRKHAGPRAGQCHGRLPPAGPGAQRGRQRRRRARRRPAPRRSRRGGHGLVGHARARGHVRRHADRPARATAAASRSTPCCPTARGAREPGCASSSPTTSR